MFQALRWSCHARQSRSQAFIYNGVTFNLFEPGRFRNALAEAQSEGRVRQLSRSSYGPPEADGASMQG